VLLRRVFYHSMQLQFRNIYLESLPYTVPNSNDHFYR